MSDDEDRLRDLAEKILREIDALPDDGRNHELRIVVGKNSGNIAGRDQIIQHGPEAPTDPSVSRRCFQCRKTTWLNTQHCIHCNTDLFAYDEEVLQQELESRRKKIMMTLSVIGFGGIYAAPHLSQSISNWAMGIGGLALFFALATFKQK